MDNRYNLERFVTAQQHDYARAYSEIAAGRKATHWMWYIFPQISGLGHSSMAVKYALQSLAEAEAYLAHPILGPRLVEISKALLSLEENNATRVMGSPDDLKLRSSMTLFAATRNADPVFEQVLEKFFAGNKDQATLQRL